MKNILLAVFLSATAAAYAQQISGRIKNFPSTQFTIRYSFDGIREKQDTVFVDDAGHFRHAWKMKYPASITVAFTDFIYQQVFIGPGLNLVMNADMVTEATYDSSLTFSGPAAKYNVYLINREISKRYRSFDIGRHFDSIMKLTEKEFLHFTQAYQFLRDSIRNAWFQPLKQDKLALYFARTDSITAAYYALQMRIRYADQLSPGERDAFYSKNVGPFIKAADEPAAATSWHYHYTWMRWLGYQRSLAIKRKGTNWFSSRVWVESLYSLADSLYPDPGFLQSLYGNRAIPFLIERYLFEPESMFPALDSAFERMIKRIKEPGAGKQFRSEQVAMRAKAGFSKMGKPAPEFMVVDSLGHYHRLSDFMGKAVVIDVWASYCGPCIAEFPYLRKLREKFGDRKDLVFLNIAVDLNRKDWIEKGLRKRSPVGLALWAGDRPADDFQKKYLIGAIPHIIVLDRNGAFVAYSAPAPSNGDALENLIREALK